MTTTIDNEQKTLNVPNLRFPEFEGEWEENYVNEICNEFKSGKAIKADLILDVGTYPVFGGNGLRGYTSTYNHDGLFVLIGRQGALCGNVRSVIGKTYITEHAIAVNGNNKSDTNFLHYLFLQMDLGRFSDQSAQPGLAVNKLLKLKVITPRIDEQRKIANLLRLLDERIATQNKIIDKLQSLIKGICNNYFLKLSHSQEMKSIRLGDILKERNEYCCKDGTFVHGTLSKDGLFPKTERWNRDFLVKEENKKYKITHLDDICYNPANLKFGVICRNIYGDLIFSPIYVTFEVSKKVNIGFIELYLTNRNFIEKIRKFEQGTVYERMSVSPEDFLSYKIRIPSLSEQTFFYQKIQRLKNCSQNELEHLNLYKKLRQYLLRQMFI